MIFREKRHLHPVLLHLNKDVKYLEKPSIWQIIFYTKIENLMDHLVLNNNPNVIPV